MSLALFRRAPAPALRAPLFSGGGRSRTLTLQRPARARGMRLAVDPRDGAVRLTLPTRTSERQALAWAEAQRGWIEAQLALLPPPLPIVPGATIPFQGTPLRIDWRAGTPRTVHHEGDTLRLGGPCETVGPRVLRWLKARALAALTAETHDFAARAGVTVAGVAIGDPRARWGSCSAQGDIRYAWRLILAPPAVREATVAHEVAHRLHMDHSAAFHAAVRRLLGRDPKAERAWLRTHGAELYWVGRDD